MKMNYLPFLNGVIMGFFSLTSTGDYFAPFLSSTEEISSRSFNNVINGMSGRQVYAV